MGGSFILQNGQNFACLMGDVQEARNSNGYVNDADNGASSLDLPE